MKKKSILLATVGLFLGLLVSCGDTGSVGSSIVQDKIEVIVDSSFVVTGKSVITERVQSRTTSQLIGKLDAKGYGKLSSDIVTQFMPASQLFSPEVTVEDIDSLVLYMFMANNEFVGDSLVPMGMEVYRLNKLLPSPIYSDFSPEGYYDASNLLGSTIYNISKRTASLGADSVYTEGVEMRVKLPVELGREIYSAYKENSANFLSPYAFAENVFKGIYIKNSFGSGRLVRSSTTLMTLYYSHYDAEKDSTIHGEGNYFAVTPEIVTNNDYKLEISDEIMDKVSAGQQILMAPVGLELDVRFPVPEIIAAFRGSDSDLSVLNSLTFTVPGEGMVNDININIPTYLLLVLSKDRAEFFAKNKLPDNVTSFYATYDATTGLYDFGDMRQYIVDLLAKDKVTEEDYTFDIIPVSCTFETTGSSYYNQSTSLATMTPYMAAPVMCRLFLDRAKVKLTYSTQTIGG